MKKQNLVLVSCFAIILLTLSIVSAGFFTGKAVDYSTKLYQGNERKIPGTSDTMKVVSANDNSAIVSINGETIEVKKGATENFNGYSVYVRDIGKLFTRYWARVQVRELSGSSGSSGTSNEPNYCGLIEESIKEKIIERLEASERYAFPKEMGEFAVSFKEGEITYKNGYILTHGCSGEGILLKVSTVINATTGYSSDSVKFTNVITRDIYQAVITQDGQGTVSICGGIYNVVYGGTSTVADTMRWVKLTAINYPDYSKCEFAKSNSQTSPKTFSLSNENSTQDVTFNGKEYTIELLSASDRTATIKVTTSDSREIGENDVREVNGLNVKVIHADETSSRLYTTLQISAA